MAEQVGMSRVKRFFLRPARTPFWQTANGKPLPGASMFLGGLVCLIIAYVITGEDYGPVEVLSGTAGNGSGWGEIVLLVTAGPFWAIGIVSFLLGSVVLIWGLSTRLGLKLARRMKEED